MLPIAALAKYSIFSIAVRWIKRILLAVFVLTFAFIVFFKYVPLPLTPLMFIRISEQQEAGKEWKLSRDWESLENISIHFQKAVIAAEDQRFFMHDGFDFEAIKQTIKTKQAKKRGASTISQQTAKNVFLWPGRSWLRKGVEVGFTFLIEWIWGKKRILEVYMNIVELGDGVYGVEAAAQRYFNKSAATLTIYEAAALAACLPAPLKSSPVSSRPDFVARKNYIAYQTFALDRIDFYKDLRAIQPTK